VIRLRVPRLPAAGDAEAAALPLCSFSLRYTTLDGEPRAIQPMSLALPALPASAFGAIAETSSLHGARMNSRRRICRRRRGPRLVAATGRCGEITQAAERIAENNPWVAESIKELRELAARKDEVMFAKESRFPRE